MMIYHFMTILSVVHTHTHTMKKNAKISYVAYELVSNFANFYIFYLTQYWQKLGSQYITSCLLHLLWI